MLSIARAIGVSLRVRGRAWVQTQVTTAAPARWLHGANLIGGTRSCDGEVVYCAYDACTGEELPAGFWEATDGEIDSAARAAEAAFSAYSRAPPDVVAALLRRVGRELSAAADDIVEVAEQETGLPDARLFSEMERTKKQLTMFATLVEEGSWVEARLNVGEGVDVRRMLQPLGPVAVFGASNFPLAFSVAGGDTAAALAAKCPVVVKVHPAHPGTSELVGEAIRRAVASFDDAAVPPGVFSMVHGMSPHTGVQLVKSPPIRAVGFTGSTVAGRLLFDTANARPNPIPVFAEMGSINPFVVLPGALREQGDAIAKGLVGSITQGCGQFCTSPGLVLVAGDAADGGNQLDTEFAAAVGRAADLSAPGIMLTANIGANFKQRTQNLDSIPGVARLTSDRFPPKVGAVWGAATVYHCSADVFAEHADVLTQEVFGPAAVIVRCADTAKLQKLLESLEGQLTATLWATDTELTSGQGEEVIQALAHIAGRVVYRGYPTGVEVCDAMNHGGPYPAATIDQTSVGTEAIKRFVRPVCFQDAPLESVLPPELQDNNPFGITRKLNGRFTSAPIEFEYSRKR